MTILHQFYGHSRNSRLSLTQKKAKRAIGFLKVITDGLAPAANLTTVCQGVLPAIAAWFEF